MNNLETASSIIRLKINEYQTKRHLKTMTFIACMIAISFIVVPRLQATGIYELIESIVLLLIILGFMNIFFSGVRLIDDSMVGYTAELIKEKKGRRIYKILIYDENNQPFSIKAYTDYDLGDGMAVQIFELSKGFGFGKNIFYAIPMQNRNYEFLQGESFEISVDQLPPELDEWRKKNRLNDEDIYKVYVAKLQQIYTQRRFWSDKQERDTFAVFNIDGEDVTIQDRGSHINGYRGGDWFFLFKPKAGHGEYIPVTYGLEIEGKRLRDE